MQLPSMGDNHSENFAHLSMGAAASCMSAIQYQSYFAKTLNQFALEMPYGLGLKVIAKTSRSDACPAHQVHVETSSRSQRTHLTTLPSYRI